MTRIGELRSEWSMSCAVSMDDEWVRWGRKYLRFTWIVLLIRLVGYNSCVLCCSFLLMEWTGFNRRHWSIKKLSSDIYEGVELRRMHNLLSEMISAYPGKSFNNFSAAFNSVITIKTWTWSRNMCVALNHFWREFLRVINNEIEFLRIKAIFSRHSNRP